MEIYFTKYYYYLVLLLSNIFLLKFCLITYTLSDFFMFVLFLLDIYIIFFIFFKYIVPLPLLYKGTLSALIYE